MPIVLYLFRPYYYYLLPVCRSLLRLSPQFMGRRDITSRPTGSSSLAIAVSDLVSQLAICISPLLKSDSLAYLLTIATKLITSILLNICSDFHSLVHAHHVPVGYLKYFCICVRFSLVAVLTSLHFSVIVLLGLALGRHSPDH